MKTLWSVDCVALTLTETLHNSTVIVSHCNAVSDSIIIIIIIMWLARHCRVIRRQESQVRSSHESAVWYARRKVHSLGAA